MASMSDQGSGNNNTLAGEASRVDLEGIMMATTVPSQSKGQVKSHGSPFSPKVVLLGSEAGQPMPKPVKSDADEAFMGTLTSFKIPPSEQLVEYQYQEPKS
ncbi:hypothetical protein ACH5RR_033742 [Cinchona calisaya]|uniref:Uncharacterized protein n=1 Tax=Cinchona calisaya TaxID=153742 RepID=A0ABD2Y8V2_9GENT